MIAFIPTPSMEWVVIFVVVLVLFGAKRLPDIARNMGKGIKEFKKVMRETKDEIKSSVDTDPAPPNSDSSGKPDKSK